MWRDCRNQRAHSFISSALPIFWASGSVKGRVPSAQGRLVLPCPSQVHIHMNISERTTHPAAGRALYQSEFGEHQHVVVNAMHISGCTVMVSVRFSIVPPPR